MDKGAKTSEEGVPQKKDASHKDGAYDRNHPKYFLPDISEEMKKILAQELQRSNLWQSPFGQSVNLTTEKVAFEMGFQKFEATSRWLRMADQSRVALAGILHKVATVIGGFLRPVHAVEEAGTGHRNSDHLELLKDAKDIVYQPLGFTEGIVDPKACQQLEIEPGRFLNISKHIQGELKEEYLLLLKRYRDIFAWSHVDLKGIPPYLGQHRIDLMEGAVPIR
ncbi:unnamed protein product [Calypogeia fissa]